ncbi:YicC/YloC family endoribonuclease [Pannonibacter tanglangensis]|uniref:YicC family protein n=1 Tax=Pannonibacter tanglangensis TaxID=2750084 RepID=A0ABW9ZGV8_9HYPH|nr:YicC/YloC family endoribonuclease [Pannonibacter sp. XCT-34]NBN64088.1 YicC family protein [Pannonibacter sp. XCT-34]
MALASMTGFARVEGAAGPVRWTWELRSVNGKSLDLRLRLPSGLEELEGPLKEQAARVLSRGNVLANLSMQRDQGEAVLTVNEAALEAVLRALQLLHRRMPEAAPPSLDGILAHKGVLELKEPVEDEASRAAFLSALAASFDTALVALAEMRAREGAAIGAVLGGHLDTIALATAAAEAVPARQPEAIRARLKQQVEDLVGAVPALDPQRLAQEAALLAAKADVREELDRLTAHVGAARKLLAEGGPVGRKLDFLAQEFNREANTLCSKSNDVALTAIGLELKAVIDQLREQVQNLE